MTQKDMSPGSVVVKNNWVIIALLSVALVVVAGIAGYLYWQNVKLEQNPESVAQEQLRNVVARVSRLILLPKGENPSIAVITNPSLLKSQAFFADAQKGDDVLMYPNAKEAILYRPATNMIINVAPLAIDDIPADGSSATTPSSAVTQPEVAP